MSGVQFDLGAFYNKLEDGLVICKSAVTGGDEIDGAVLKITKKNGENSFPVDTISAVRNNDDGSSTTLTRVDSGSEPGADQILFNSSESSISYKTNSSGHVTITGIPDGEYELEEITTPAGYRTAEKISFKVVNGNIQNCSSATGNTITMIDKKPSIDYKKCIRCFCCQEFCPIGAMKVRRTAISKLLEKIR